MSFWQKLSEWFSHKKQQSQATPQVEPVVKPVDPDLPQPTPTVITPPIVIEGSPEPVSKDWPPFAHVCKAKMKTKGKYAKGWPSGAVVHFTAGRDGAEKTINGGIGNGYTFWCIQRDGKLFVANKANEWGHHCGESAWNKYTKKLVGSISDDCIGIEINAAGRVTPLNNGKFQTWFKTEVKSQDVRYTEGKDNQLKGWYEKFTDAQEETLIETLLWLKKQNPDVFDFDFVLGHDEVSGPKGIGYWRKNDPGAALSRTMSDFREHLKKEYAKRNKN